MNGNRTAFFLMVDGTPVHPLVSWARGRNRSAGEPSQRKGYRRGWSGETEENRIKGNNA